MGRDAAKRAREEALLQEFIVWLKSNESTDYRIVDRPDPPDAIITSSLKTTWIEHADIVRSDEEAHELFSLLNPEEPRYFHKGLAIDGHDGLPREAVRTLAKKLTKASYASICTAHGPGLLLLSEMDPLFDESTLREIVEDVREFLRQCPEVNRGYFERVYLRYWDNNRQQYTYIKLVSFDTDHGERRN